jgi:hypothetical protein
VSKIEVFKEGKIAETKDFVCTIEKSLLSDEADNIQLYQIKNKLTNLVEHEAQYLASALLVIQEMQGHLDAVLARIEDGDGDDIIEIVDGPSKTIN